MPSPGVFKHAADAHGFLLGIGYFNADRVFSRQWRHHAHCAGTQGPGHVIGQARDLADLDPGCQLEFVHGYHGSRFCGNDMCIDIELCEETFKHRGLGFHHLFLLLCITVFGLCQEGKRWQCIVIVRRLDIGLGLSRLGAIAIDGKRS